MDTKYTNWWQWEDDENLPDLYLGMSIKSSGQDNHAFTQIVRSSKTYKTSPSQVNTSQLNMKWCSEGPHRVLGRLHWGPLAGIMPEIDCKNGFVHLRNQPWTVKSVSLWLPERNESKLRSDQGRRRNQLTAKSEVSRVSSSSLIAPSGLTVYIYDIRYKTSLPIIN